MKETLKKILIIWLIVCTLLPSLFSEIVLADTEVYLTTERAGNFASNFAINFYENWSSVTKVVENTRSSGDAKRVQSGEYIWPLDVMVVNDEYGALRDGKPHLGTDLNGNVGDNVYASHEGTVIDIFKGCNHFSNMSDTCGGGYGNHVKIKDDNGIIVIYGHMNEVTVNLGDTVEKGQLIGKVGSSGSSTGPHLHFEFWSRDQKDIEGLREGIDHFGYIDYKAAYTINPRVYVDFESSDTGSTTTSNPTTVSKKESTIGKIKTEYDSTVNPKAEVEEKIDENENYKFNNLSWIGFVFSKSLFVDGTDMGIDDILTDNLEINLNRFDDKYKISGIKETVNTSDVLDISRLINEGRVLPGDILVAEDGDGGREYLLYVGGAKILYATENPKAYASGALKYEYLNYYIRRIRVNLQEKYGENYNEEHRYGISQVYRIKKSTAEKITDKQANLFFNGKGYYSSAKYYGLPSKMSVSETKINILEWVFSKFKQIIDFLVNLIFYTVRMQILGWANIIDNLIQQTVLGISGNDTNSALEGAFGSSGTTASGDRVTVESIFFNRIPILDANFFNDKTAGGYSLLLDGESSTVKQVVEDDTYLGEPQVVETENKNAQKDQDNLIYKLRLNLKMWYAIIRGLSIAILLFMLIVYGIKIAIGTSVDVKAKYKQLLLSWLTAMCIVLFIHMFMYFVFIFNDECVGLCEKWANNTAHSEINYLVEDSDDLSQAQQEMNLYDAVRVKAYSFNWREGVPATIIYIFLIYLMLRFLLIYLKRYITIYILALSGSFMGVKYAIEKLQGKKSKSMTKWFKDFAFNVFLQTIHAMIYLVFMAVALNVASTSVSGAFIAFIILNFMLKADDIIIKIFGLNKSDSLAAVNKPESWKQTLHKFMPMITISKGAFGLVTGLFTGLRSPIYRFRLWTTGKDNLKDAQKELERRKYARIGAIARHNVVTKGLSKLDAKIQKSNNILLAPIRMINRTPIRNLWAYNEAKRKLGDNISKDLNKYYLQSIKNAKALNRQRFIRPLKTMTNVALGLGGMIAAPAIAIADVTAGATVFSAAKGRLNKYRTIGGFRKDSERYYGRVGKALNNVLTEQARLDNAIQTYTDNEYDYQERRNQLLDELALKTPGSADYTALRQQIRDMDNARAAESAKEIHEAELAQEALYEAKNNYGNAKHAQNADNKLFNFAATITGANMFGDIAKNDAEAAYKAGDDYKKSNKKLDDLAKVADLESGVRSDIKELIAKYKQYGIAHNIDEKDAMDLLKQDLDNTRKESKKINIKTADITNAINEYLYENHIDKITSDDVNGVLNKLERMYADAGKTLVFSPETREKVRKRMKKKLVKDDKGLGYDTKDATVELRNIFGDDDVMTANRRTVVNDNDINDLQSQLLEKMRKLNTYNEVGKIKYKESLINLNKSLKDAKKSIGK